MRAADGAWLVGMVVVFASAAIHRAALARLVGALPRCGACGRPATRAWGRGADRYCDAHAPDGCPDDPRAEPLRDALLLLGFGGEE